MVFVPEWPSLPSLARAGNSMVSLFRLPCDFSPSGGVDAAKFTGDIRPLEERDPADKSPRLAGRTVGKLRIAVQARTGRVAPRAMARLEGRNHPAVSAIRMARRVGRGKHLIRVGLCGKFRRALSITQF